MVTHCWSWRASYRTDPEKKKKHTKKKTQNWSWICASHQIHPPMLTGGEWSCVYRNNSYSSTVIC